MPPGTIRSKTNFFVASYGKNIDQSVSFRLPEMRSYLKCAGRAHTKTIIRERCDDMMRSFIETAAIVAACGSAIFWFASAMCHLPRIKPGMDEHDEVAELSARLRRMSRRNFWAAGLMGITALLSAWLRFLG